MISLLSLSETKLADIISAEIARCDKRGIDWRGLVMSRHVLEVPIASRPSPDGSSVEYVALAYTCGVKHRDSEAPFDPILTLFDEIVQSELSRSLIHERTLIKSISV